MEFERNLLFSLLTVLDVVSFSQVCFAIFPMDKNIEQRICLKFFIVNGILCVESLEMLQIVSGESTLSKTRAYECRDVVEDLPRSGRPSSSTKASIAKVKGMVTANRHLSLREIAAEFSVSHESIRTILNDFWKENSWILHHDNVLSHKAIIVIEQPAY